MTQLGQARGYQGTVYSNATSLDTLPVNAVVRNGCETSEPLDRGIYFIKSNGSWHPYSVKTNSKINLDPFVEGFSSSQVYLPAEQISAQRLMQWRADLKLSEEVVGPVRKVFEQALGMNGWYRKTSSDCECYDDDDYHDEGCFDGVSEIAESVVAAAWLTAAKSLQK